jgi:hypothetical protein
MESVTAIRGDMSVSAGIAVDSSAGRKAERGTLLYTIVILAYRIAIKLP